ncbi:MAG: FAD binding domain-containing protein [Anaerolineae bacterium]
MITAYHRPHTLDDALALLRRPSPQTVPLGGGTLLAHEKTASLEVVDLQALSLDHITGQGKNLEIGAAVTLQALLEHEGIPTAMQPALKLEAPLNLRNAATVAGTLVTCDGRSTFTTIMLALDARLSVYQLPAGTEVTLSLGAFLTLRPACLITSLTIPMQVRLAFEYVSRTPADKPIVCVAAAQWPSGRTRLAVGGYGSAPRLGMDGTEAEGIETAASNAFHDSGDDWGSAEYRMDVAATLARRCLSTLSA